MSVGATLVAALLAVLDRPSTWALGLAGFLVRGGVVLVAAPIVVLPTAGGLANILAPLLEDVAFGRRTIELAGTVAIALAGVVVWVVGGGLLAALAEVEAARRVAADLDGLPPAGPVVGRAIGALDRGWRVVAVRLAALFPFVLALAWGASRIAAVGYRELTVPSDVTVPVSWRIAIGAPDAIIGILLTWLVGETVGAMAARRVALYDERARDALRQAVRRIVRAPRRPLGLAAIGVLVGAAVVAATALATGTAWEGVRIAFGRGDASAATIALLVVFVGLFAGGLLLIGLTAAWRGAMWTVEAVAEEDRTFGGGTGSRTGDKHGIGRLPT